MCSATWEAAWAHPSPVAARHVPSDQRTLRRVLSRPPGLPVYVLHRGGDHRGRDHVRVLCRGGSRFSPHAKFAHLPTLSLGNNGNRDTSATKRPRRPRSLRKPLARTIPRSHRPSLVGNAGAVRGSQRAGAARAEQERDSPPAGFRAFEDRSPAGGGPRGVTSPGGCCVERGWEHGIPNVSLSTFEPFTSSVVSKNGRESPAKGSFSAAHGSGRGGYQTPSLKGGLCAEGHRGRCNRGGVIVAYRSLVAVLHTVIGEHDDRDSLRRGNDKLAPCMERSRGETRFSRLRAESMDGNGSSGEVASLGLLHRGGRGCRSDCSGDSPSGVFLQHVTVSQLGAGLETFTIWTPLQLINIPDGGNISFATNEWNVTALIGLVDSESTPALRGSSTGGLSGGSGLNGPDRVQGPGTSTGPSIGRSTTRRLAYLPAPAASPTSPSWFRAVRAGGGLWSRWPTTRQTPSNRMHGTAPPPQRHGDLRGVQFKRPGRTEFWFDSEFQTSGTGITQPVVWNLCGVSGFLPLVLSDVAQVPVALVVPFQGTDISVTSMLEWNDSSALRVYLGPTVSYLVPGGWSWTLSPVGPVASGINPSSPLPGLVAFERSAC